MNTLLCLFEIEPIVGRREVAGGASPDINGMAARNIKERAAKMAASDIFSIEINF